MKTNITKWLEKEYPRGVELVFIDYRDRIEDAEKREALLQSPDDQWDILDCDSWVSDSEYQSIEQIERNYFEETKIELTEEESEELREWCLEHDTSNVLKDLLKNTGREYLYYDTGVYIDSLEGVDEKGIEKVVKQIAKTLRVDYTENAKDLRLMVGQASYGGQLVILFENSIGEFMQDAKYIKFDKDAEVCIMDRGQGSGDSTKIKGDMLFEFKRENLHSDKGDNGYSYSDDVCGLISGIMEDGYLTNKRSGKVIKVSTNEERKAQREREAEFIKKWNNGRGECSFGDMNFKRHKETPYRNNFPCGNKCLKCGTFWID